MTVLQPQTGRTLSTGLALDSQDPTTGVLGDLVELQETYGARWAIPPAAHQVPSEMVGDDLTGAQLS
ncbi:hypothetical protein, partial [Methylobacterium sp. J-068]|uniref:hypothetical protein n=1 Tax=Methylobacterium sp. J-068 TaxID=2836649 RepID=UPI001FBA18D6